MKTKKTNKQFEISKQDDGCCGSIVDVIETSQTSCCEQPTDGSSCCDKTESKKVNIEKTGCC